MYYEDFLYDLVTDPHERNNLVANQAYAATRVQLAALLVRKMEEAGECCHSFAIPPSFNDRIVCSILSMLSDFV